MTPEQEQVLREARETLDRTATIVAREQPVEDAGLRWRRKNEQHELEREHERRKNEVKAIERRIEAQVRASLTETFKAIVDEEHKYMVEQLLPELINELKDAIADDVSAEIERAYRLAFADMRSDIQALRDAIRKALGTDAIDLPAIPLRSKPN
jgi:hypothetical protein